MRLAVLFVVALCGIVPYVSEAQSPTIITTSKPIVHGEKIIFGQLPRGECYRTEVPAKAWILSSYEDIARKVILSIRDSPPYDLIKDGIKTKSYSGAIIDRSLSFEAPFAVPSAISLLASLVIPLTGLIFCCCRYFGRCGGKLEEEDMEFSPVKSRHRLSVAIAFCSVFILIGSSCIFIASNRLGTSFPVLNTVLEESVDDVITYKNNTIKELKYVTVSEMKFTSDLVAEDLDAISQQVVGPVMGEARTLVAPLLDALVSTGNVVSKMRAILKNISVTVSELKSLNSELRQQLYDSRQNLTDVRAACNADMDAKLAGICDQIPSGDALVAVADFNKVPNVTKELESIEDVLRTDISIEARKGNVTFEEIPLSVARSTYSGRQDIANSIAELEDLSSDLINQLEEAAEQFVQTTLEPFREEMNSYVGPSGSYKEYDTLRFFSFIGLACTVLLGVLIMYCGLTAGVLGSRDYDTPSTRSLTSDAAGRTLMASVTFFFLCSLFLNLLVGLLFFLSSNATILCKSAADLSLIEKTVDDPSFLGYYPLSKTLLGDGNVEIKLSDVLRGCEQDESPWQLLHLDTRFNLTNMTNYRDKIPPMDEIFKELNSTIAGVTILTLDAEQTLNDTLDAGVHLISFGNFTKQTQKPLVNVSLDAFSSDLKNVSDTARPTNEGVADGLVFIANRLQMIQTDIIETSEGLVSLLNSKVILLEEKSNITLESIKDVFTRTKALDGFLRNRALVLANEASHRNLGRILGWIDQYIEEALLKIRQDVGNCSPIRTIYDANLSAACEYLLSALNALWLSLGTIALFLVLTIILCVRLAKHYRRAERSSSSAKATIYGIPLTLFTSSSRSSSRKAVTSWKKVNKNSPVPFNLHTMRWV
ncbi:prominin-1-A [Nematostella vectensis]|uniref:prominin-1-A n=1 Tax=Nematostella vectensis TaxID=45351 RepID=UPI002076E281|nr:prominin-1-A [Nematostella vectensis]